MHRFRIWGSSDLRRWLPLDVHRPLRSTLITLDVPGTRPSPAFTPARPDEFTALLDELLSQRELAAADRSAHQRVGEDCRLRLPSAMRTYTDFMAAMYSHDGFAGDRIVRE